MGLVDLPRAMPAVTVDIESFRETLWGTTDGRKIAVKDLTSSHLTNILNWIKDRPNQYPNNLYDYMQREAEYRRIVDFASDKGYPMLVDGKWELIGGILSDHSDYPETKYPKIAKRS